MNSATNSKGSSLETKRTHHCRIVGCDRNHRDPVRAVVASGSSFAFRREANNLPKQHPANRTRNDELPLRSPVLSFGDWFSTRVTRGKQRSTECVCPDTAIC